jgi:uncharacterized membrane protein
MDSESSIDDAAFAERLRSEVAGWQQDGMIRPDQAEALLAHYGLMAGETEKTLRRSRFVTILAVLGVVLIGIGVILMVGANWQEIPKLGRLGILVLATLACYISGYRMAYQSQTYPKVGMALLLLGSLIWGAGIFLIGQMYQAGGEGGEKNAVLYWFIGVAPLAYILLSPLHLTLSLALGTIWFIMGLTTIANVPAHAHMLPFLLLGVALYSLGHLHSLWPKAERLNLPYRWLGLVYVFAALYAFSFKDLWYESYYSASGAEYSHLWVWLGPILAIGAMVTIGMTLTRDHRDRTSIHESLALFFLLALGAGILAAGPALCVVTHVGAYSSGNIGAAAFFNLVLLAAEIGVIALGWARGEAGLVNFGILVFSLQVFTRYFDLLGTMFSGGLMFIGAGLLLVVGGFLMERSRRRLIETMAQRRSI